MSEPAHGAECKWAEGGKPCRQYSTDGTRLGAEIAHTMGTTDEDKIVRDAHNAPVFRSDVDEDQADWEEGEYDEDGCCDAQDAVRLMQWGNTEPVRTVHEPLPYPAESLEWTEPRLPGPTQV